MAAACSSPAPRGFSVAASFCCETSFTMGPMPTPRDILKPPPLHRGDTIGIVAPASNVDRAMLETGVANLEKLGYQVVMGESILDQDLYFAGSAQARARDLMRMFQRSDVHAIIC